MSDHVIFFNDYFELIEERDHYAIRFLKAGLDVGELSQVFNQIPRLQLTEFAALKSASLLATGKKTVIGTKKPKVEVRVSKDRMIAYLKLNMTNKAFEEASKEDLVKEILELMVRENVVYGYDIRTIPQKLQVEDEIAVAKGLYPTKGDDAVVTYYDVGSPQPRVHSDDTVDHYELELIHNVHQGDWLGERLEPTLGILGKTVTGEGLAAIAGRQEKLLYDSKSVEEVFVKPDKKTYLYAKRNGAVVMNGEKIGVLDYLEIDGSVSFHTGNIDFDGFVGVTDTVDDNFSISAEQDVQVLGDLGVGAVDFIESRQGNIYIKGGIAGKNKARILCHGNLYTKFAADCTIECEGTVNIGFYAMNCSIKAKEVVMESQKSRIIGGFIEADMKVVSAEVGNRSEIPTHIQINGFDREALKEKHDRVEGAITQYNEKLQTLGQKLAIYRKMPTLSEKDRVEYEKLADFHDQLSKNLELLKGNLQQYKSYLATKGEGEVRITRKLHGNVRMSFKGMEIMSEASELPLSYFTRNNEIIID